MPDSQPADDVDPVRFVWTCLRVHRDVQAVREAVDAIERGLDWLPVANYALAHKVIPQLYRGLRCLPVDAVPNALLTQFAVLQADIEAFNSRKTGALGTVATEFADAGITGVAYKGPVVALTAYGSLAGRQFADLDWLVAEHDVAAAREVLRGLGYYHLRKSLTWEETWRLGEPVELELDLHWRLGPQRPFQYWISFAFDAAAAISRAQTILLDDGTPVPAFSAEDALIAQSQTTLKNGFNTALAQMRWVCDIDGLVCNQPPDWRVMLNRAREGHCLRPLLLCLAVSARTLRTPLPDDVARLTARDTVVGKLAETVINNFLRGAPAAEYATSSKLRIAASLQDRLGDRLPYWSAAAAAMFAPTERDRQFIALPDGLQRLYYVVRPVRLMRDWFKDKSNQAPR
ncbi:MAG: nucleotidyltransferase family protein [Gammaproteobacteria bacterium]|nr:nucleotidyltransferase family protein [Gammaproteobacteria bacterium]